MGSCSCISRNYQNETTLNTEKYRDIGIIKTKLNIKNKKIETKIKSNFTIMKSIIKMQSIFRGIRLRKRVKSGFRINSKFDNQDNVIKYHNIKSKKIVRKK